MKKQKLTSFEKSVLKTFLYNPLDYKDIIKGKYQNERYALAVIKKYIPTDTGIEFEIGNDNIDLVIYDKRNNLDTRFREFTWCDSFEISTRIRKISDFTRIHALFDLLLVHGKFPENGGIHIHTNIKYRNYDYDHYQIFHELHNSRKLNDEFFQFLNDEIFKYTGNYNLVGISCCKDHIVCTRRDNNTIEYRGINCTFSYSTLLKWVMICHLSTRLMLNTHFRYHALDYKSLMLDIMSL